MKKIIGSMPFLLVSLAGCNCAGDALESSFDEAMAEAVQRAEQEAAAAAAAPAAAAAAEEARYTCNQIQNNQLCYTIAPMAALVTGEQGGCEMPGGTWSEGDACPTEGIVATCTKERNAEVRHFYEGVSLENAETACTAFGGTFTPAS